MKQNLIFYILAFQHHLYQEQLGLLHFLYKKQALSQLFAGHTFDHGSPFPCICCVDKPGYGLYQLVQALNL